MPRKKAAVSRSIFQTPTPERHWLVVRGARQNNLKNIDVPFPLGALSVVTGVSGSGKSSLINDILWKSLSRTLHRSLAVPGAHDRLDGVEFLNKVIRVDQQPIGQTPTSNPATYTGVFELIRELFSQLPESKLRGYTPRRFSFNVPGGRCEKCEGAGQLKIEMHFLPDVWITCDACGGKRYDRQTLDVKFRGHSIAEVLEMSCGDAVKLFDNIPGIRRILTTLCDVGLDYLSLGQAAPTLSGGEAQRVKLASELARPDTGQTLYLLDEPTTGLHFDDLQKLLDVLHRLVDLGNTVIVIEHNLDVIKTADWVVDLGPEAGAGGGYLVFAGIPEELDEQSHTARALLPVLRAGPLQRRPVFDPEYLNETREGDVSLRDVGADAKMPWEVDGPRWHTKDRISRRGQPIRWDGRILSKIVRHIEESKRFAPTDWGTRTIVEIRALKKSLGWFFHAITAEEWLLKMKFRTARNTFRRETLIAKLDLKPLNEMDEIPLYGTESRVRVQSRNGPWQEIELRVHSLEEIDKPAFWDFLDLAIREFAKYAKKAEKSSGDLMPWKVLGEKWHFLPKGLIGGDKLLWDVSLLRELFGMLVMISPSSRTVWTNKMMVPFFRPLSDRPERSRKSFAGPSSEARRIPWVVVHTKRVDALYLDVYVAKNSVPLGKVRSLGLDVFVNGENEHYDIVQLKFSKKSEITDPELKALLRDALKSDI